MYAEYDTVPTNNIIHAFDRLQLINGRSLDYTYSIDKNNVYCTARINVINKNTAQGILRVRNVSTKVESRFKYLFRFSPNENGVIRGELIMDQLNGENLIWPENSSCSYIGWIPHRFLQEFHNELYHGDKYLPCFSPVRISKIYTRCICNESPIQKATITYNS